MICKPPSHPHGGVRCDTTMYKWPCMVCHILHMSCGCMGKTLQAWDVTHTCGCPPSRPQTTKSMGLDFVGFANHQAIPREVWYVIRGPSDHGWVTIYFTYLVNARERSHKLGIPTIKVIDLPICDLLSANCQQMVARQLKLK